MPLHPRNLVNGSCLSKGRASPSGQCCFNVCNARAAIFGANGTAVPCSAAHAMYDLAFTLLGHPISHAVADTLQPLQLDRHLLQRQLLLP